VELEGDIDGLVYISQISEDRVDKIKDHLKVGQDIEARVIKVDKTERRIGSTGSPRAASRSRRRTTTRKSSRRKRRPSTPFAPAKTWSAWSRPLPPPRSTAPAKGRRKK
jgi:small subunit ribosomal protein S1